MNDSGTLLSIETATHVIEVSEGCLTIGTKRFPDNCISLTPEEALKALLWSKYGPNTIAAIEQS